MGATSRKKDTMSLISRLLNSRTNHRALHLKGRRASGRRLHIEPLENRWMLTTTATHFEVLAPASVTAGTAFNVTVEALDASNNVVSNYTGTVHFSSTDGAPVLPADTMQTSGIAMYSVTLNSIGSQTITVTDSANSITGTSQPIAVDAATSVTLSAAPNPSALGQQVTFTATVSSVDPANGTPTGTVQFIIDGANFGSPVTLSGGVASVNDSVLSASTHTITATYSGDTTHAGSTSSPLTQNVLSVQQQVQIIQGQIATLGLNKGNTNSLDVKLNLKGNHGDIGKVGAFINEVRALTKAHKISQTEANMLIMEANDLLISLHFVETMAQVQHGQAKRNA
jgi:hypothetical protein